MSGSVVDANLSDEGGATAAGVAASAASAGLFTSRLCVDGVWKEFVLDDFFPCHAGGDASAVATAAAASVCAATPPGSGDDGGLCLSRAHGPALWVSMLEKAYARVKGSYSAALGGCCPGQGGGSETREKDEEDDGGGGVRAVTAGAGGVVARPTDVLAVFTGAPVLYAELTGGTGCGGEEVGREAGRASSASVIAAAEQLWGSVVSTRHHGARGQAMSEERVWMMGTAVYG